MAGLPADTLAVVDQRRNIGALAVRRARAAGRPVAYLPGSAEHELAESFPGIAETDERDAQVIARAALGMPQALGPVPAEDAEAELEGAIAGSLAGNAGFENLQTMPGIGPRTAAQLVVSVDISELDGHDKLASHCGLAPSTQRSGTSIDYDRGHRGGNKPLKNLLIFSCNSLARSKGRYGEYMRGCLARGMKHKCALKATARKRMRVIYAVMRDGAPYSA